jgi:hypothetical protein
MNSPKPDKVALLPTPELEKRNEKLDAHVDKPTTSNL